MSEVEGNLVCISKNIDKSRFELIEGDSIKASDSDEVNEDSDDSVFETGQKSKEVQLRDTKKNRVISSGSKVKLQISDIQVSEGTLILEALLI